MPGQDKSASEIRRQLSSSWRRLCIASVIAIVVHLVAGLCMATILRQGLDTTAEFAYRLSFLTENRSLWITGWLSWNIAALSILYFYFCFAEAYGYGNNSSGWVLRFAVLIATGGIAADLGAEALEMGLLPDLAQKILTQPAGVAAMETETFLATHRAAVMMTGYVANGLYTISAALLIFATRHQYSKLVQLVGYLVVTGGILLSASCLANSVSGMVWSNAVLMPALLVWLTCVAFHSARRSKLPGTE